MESPPGIAERARYDAPRTRNHGARLVLETRPPPEFLKHLESTIAVGGGQTLGASLQGGEPVRGRSECGAQKVDPRSPRKGLARCVRLRS